ncbi:MAG: hypothetical protein HY720_30360 [Planctomycetes bacterium]|nr:hypothetical protein [Planctomycetota bacterium]
MSERARSRALLLGAALASFLAAGLLQEAVLDGRRREERLDPLELEGEVSLQIFFAQKLSVVRPIVIDACWVLAEDSYRDRKWWELRSRYEDISKLQPYSQDVWEYNAYNLVYNISAEMPTPGEQWPWIAQGIEFAMEGARINPESWRLPLLIAHFLDHKCDVQELFRSRAKEVFGEGRKSHFELAAEWKERAIARPGHMAAVCGTLFQYTYPMAMAEALYEGDEAGYLDLVRRAKEVFAHARSAHPVQSLDLDRDLPARGQVLARRGTQELLSAHAMETYVPGLFERARRFYELAAAAWRAEGAAAPDSREGRVARLEAEAAEALVRVSELLGEARRLRAIPDPIGAGARVAEAREEVESRFLYLWIPYAREIGPAGRPCQAFGSRFPGYLEDVYAEILARP